MPIGVSLTSWGGASLALADQLSTGGVTIKIPYGVDLLLYQPASNPSFPIGLVKTESDFVVKSVEIGLRRYTLVTVTSVDAYSFLAFSDLTCHSENTGIRVFQLHCST